jgi:hypothetical protein
MTAVCTNAYPSVWMVASPTPPQIICPPWCVDSTDDHLRDLSDYEGRSGTPLVQSPSSATSATCG